MTKMTKKIQLTISCPLLPIGCHLLYNFYYNKRRYSYPQWNVHYVSYTGAPSQHKPVASVTNNSSHCHLSFTPASHKKGRGKVCWGARRSKNKNKETTKY